MPSLSHNQVHLSQYGLSDLIAASKFACSTRPAGAAETDRRAEKVYEPLGALLDAPQRFKSGLALARG